MRGKVFQLLCQNHHQQLNTVEMRYFICECMTLHNNVFLCVCHVCLHAYNYHGFEVLLLDIYIQFSKAEYESDFNDYFAS